MFIGFLIFLESNLAGALLLLVLLLTCGMMALEIKSGRGAGGRAQRLPPKALGGSKCTLCLLVVVVVVVVVVAVVVVVVLVVP